MEFEFTSSWLRPRRVAAVGVANLSTDPIARFAHRNDAVGMSFSNPSRPDDILLPIVVSQDDKRLNDDTIRTRLAGPVVVVYQHKRKWMTGDSDLGDMTLQELHEEAIANLERAVGGLELDPMAGCVIPKLNGKIETSLLLHGRLCAEVADRLGGGQLLAIAACEGGLIFATTDSGGERNLYPMAEVLVDQMGEPIEPGIILRAIGFGEWRADD